MNQNSATLSVIVPVYNAERYVSKCIDSLLAQTYTDFELILVVNGSTDASAEICHAYASRAAVTCEIRVLEQTKPSVSAARNAGINAARGRYVTFMDSDDWVEEEYLAEFFRLPLPEGNVLVMQNRLIDTTEDPCPPCPNHILFNYTDTTFKSGDPIEKAMEQQFLHDGFTSCKLYDKALIRRHSICFPEDISLREDHLFMLHYIAHADTFVWREGAGMHYMCRGKAAGSLLSRHHPVEELLRTIELFETMISTLFQRFQIPDPEYVSALYDNLILSMLIRTAQEMNLSDYKQALQAIVAHRIPFKNALRRPHPLLTRTTWRLLERLPQQLYILVFWQIQLRKLSLQVRGHLK